MSSKLDELFVINTVDKKVLYKRDKKRESATDEFQGINKYHIQRERFTLNFKRIQTYLNNGFIYCRFYKDVRNKYHVILCKSQSQDFRAISKKGATSGAIVYDYVEDIFFNDQQYFRLINKQALGKDVIQFELTEFSNNDPFAMPDPEITVSAPTLSGRHHEVYEEQALSRESKEGYEKYRNDVDNLTRENLVIYSHMLNERKQDDHVDHIYSVKDGFDNQIPPEVIGHRINLRWLNKKVNGSKGSRSDMTLSKLTTLFILEESIEEYYRLCNKPFDY